MDELCSASTKSTDVYSRIRLKLTRHDIYLPKFRCQVTLKTNPGDYIWIKFKELNIESICKNDWLELADGPSRSYPYIAGMEFILSLSHSYTQKVFEDKLTKYQSV